VKGEKKLRDTVREIALELISLQSRLHKVGLIKTAHKANDTMKELGWEAAEKFKESK